MGNLSLNPNSNFFVNDSTINSELDKVNNKLLLEYNEKFNKLYQQKLSLDKFIMNKEELVNKENDEALLKDHSIIILSTVIYIYITIVILYGLYYIKLYGFDAFIFLTITTIIYISYNSYAEYKNVNSKLLFNQNIKVAAVTMSNYVDNQISKVFPRKCPTNCNIIQDEEEIYDITSNGKITPKIHPTLNSSPQINVWKHGDVPTDLFTKPGYNNIYINPSKLPNYNGIDNSPKSEFGAPINSGATYYECKWIGANTHDGLPNQEPTKYSTIPCSYRENYKESGKYLCPSNIDPNKLGSPIGCVDTKELE